MTVGCSLERFIALRELIFSFSADPFNIALDVLSTCGSRLHVLRFIGLSLHHRTQEAESVVGGSQDGGNPSTPYTFNTQYDDGLEQLDAIARTSDVLKELRELHFQVVRMGRDRPQPENLLSIVQRRLPVLLAQKGTQWSVQWQVGDGWCL